MPRVHKGKTQRGWTRPSSVPTATGQLEQAGAPRGGTRPPPAPLAEAAIPRRAQAHAARRGGQPGEAKSRPGTQARDAERRSAGRAPGRDPRRRRRARPRSGPGAGRSGGPTRAHRPWMRSGEARAVRRGRDPPAAASVARGAERRPAGPLAGQIRPYGARGTGPARVRAECQQRQLGGAGFLARHAANRAENKVSRGDRGSNGCADSDGLLALYTYAAGLAGKARPGRPFGSRISAKLAAHPFTLTGDCLSSCRLRVPILQGLPPAGPGPHSR